MLVMIAICGCSFHHLHPQIAIITNIEEDHLDCYKNIDEIVESFRKFAQLVPEDGLIIAGGKDARVIKTLAGIAAPIELCALEAGFSWSSRILSVKNGCYQSEVE